ncbi:hypothetical protein I315_04904 [Cryptococcus gattii Ru294]|nr:hypothetical protein I315_04904 [Cryptococcus gattii Ru294]
MISRIRSVHYLIISVFGSIIAPRVNMFHLWYTMVHCWQQLPSAT